MLSQLLMNNAQRANSVGQNMTFNSIENLHNHLKMPPISNTQNMKSERSGMAKSASKSLYGKLYAHEPEADFDLALHLPLKSHLMRLENSIIELHDDLADNKNMSDNIIKPQLHTLYTSHTENLKDFFSSFIDDLTNLKKNFVKNTNIEKAEVNALLKETNQAKQDDLKLKQQILILDDRINKFNRNIGYPKH